MSLNPCDCDWDSEFDFRWHGPSSICDWSCKVLLLTVYSSITCFEIVFCRRWRDCLPLPPPTVPVQENEISDKETEMNNLSSMEGRGADNGSSGSSGGNVDTTDDSKKAGDEED